MMKHGKTFIVLVIFGAALACTNFSQFLSSDELSEIPTDSSLNSLAWTMMTGSKSSDLLGDCSEKNANHLSSDLNNQRIGVVGSH